MAASSYEQWRSQGVSFGGVGGGGGGANAKGVSHARGVREHAPRENFEMYTLQNAISSVLGVNFAEFRRLNRARKA